MRMATAPEQKHWTIADWDALPADGMRYEIIDGELFVTPAPTWDHQGLAGRLFIQLTGYMDQTGLGVTVMPPADVELADDTVVQPDAFVVPIVGAVRPRKWKDITRLLLAIEVLSPGTARVDRTVKRKRYQRAGVAEYWIVDGEARLIERWRPEDERPEIITDELVWQPDPTHEPLRIELPALFAAVLDE